MTFSPRYRALVYASLRASFLVVVGGAIVRVTGSGLGCPDWPLCHGQFLPSLDPATRIEWTHRFLAIVSGLTVAAMVAWTFVAYRSDRRALVLAVAVAVLYPLQAVLGAMTVVLELPPEWVTVHLANAELLLAALTILAVVVPWPAPSARRPWAWAPWCRDGRDLPRAGRDRRRESPDSILSVGPRRPPRGREPPVVQRRRSRCRGLAPGLAPGRLGA